MQIHQVKRNTENKDKRYVGRGGKRGKTAGRGTKGQNARAGRKFRPQIRDVIKKLPKMRGRGKNTFKSVQEKPFIVNLADIVKHFKNGGEINPKILMEKRLAETQKGRTPKIKILGDAEVSKAYKVSGCLVSGSVKAKITAAGGSVE